MKRTTLFLTMLLTGCLGDDTVRYAYPPDAYLSECPITYTDRTEHGVIDTLAAAVWCERLGKQAARCWVATHKGVKSSPECRIPVPCEESHIKRGGSDVGGATDDGGRSCIPGGVPAHYNTDSSEAVKGET